jgi:hypothetical protein
LWISVGVRWRLCFLLFVVAALVGGGMWFTKQSEKGDRELPVYVTGSERMVVGEEVYRAGKDAKPFTYPPFSGVLFVPFVWLPVGWHPAVWFGVNFVMLLMLLRWLHRWSVAGRARVKRPRPGWLWLGVALLAARHVASVFENQSHDLLVFGIVALGVAFWTGRGLLTAAIAGAFLGAAAATKATPLLFLWVFFVRWLAGRPRRQLFDLGDARSSRSRALTAALFLLASATVCSILPDWIYPRQDGHSWAYAWWDVNLRGLSVGGTADTAGAWGSHSFLNQSLSGTLTRLFSPSPHGGTFVRNEVMVTELQPWQLTSVRLAGSVLVLAWIAWGAVRARRAGLRSYGRWSRFGEAALVLCGMVLLSPQSSKAHFCVLLVPAVFVVDRLLRGRRDLLLLTLVSLAAVLATGSAKGLIGRDLGNLVLAAGSVTWSTVLLMLATLRALRSVSDGEVSRDATAVERLDRDRGDLFVDPTPVALVEPATGGEAGPVPAT